MPKDQKSLQQQPKRIFVYGTLKEGEALHDLMCEAGGRRIPGFYKTLIEFPLVVGGLPYLLPLPTEGKNVKGEVYEVPRDGLHMLDRVEGHPHSYRRSDVYVVRVGPPQKEMLVQAYFYIHIPAIIRTPIAWFTDTNQPEPM